MIVFDKNGRQVELIEKKKSISIGNFFLARANGAHNIEGFFPFEFANTASKLVECTIYSINGTIVSVPVYFQIANNCLFIRAEFQETVQKGECVSVLSRSSIVLNAL